MSESFEKAVEAAAILSCATLDQDRIWHNLLDEEEREDYRKNAAAMLRAALPFLAAQDVPHVARDAWWEGWDAETAWQDDIDHRTIPTVERKDNPYAEEGQ